MDGQLVPVHYPHLVAFLHDYRANLAQNRMILQLPEAQPGASITARLSVPGLGRELDLSGTVSQRLEGGLASVALAASDSDAAATLEGFYRSCGEILTGLLASGWFRLVNDPSELARIEAQARGGGLMVTGAPAAAPQSGATPQVAGAQAAPAADGRLRAPNGELIGDAAWSGPSGSSELIQALLKISMERQQGVLRIEDDRGVRSVYFTRTGVVQVRHEPVILEETFGQLLVAAGRITSEQAAQSVKMMNETGKKQGECLMELEVLTFADVVQLLNSQVQIVLKKTLLNPGSRFSFHPIDYKHPWITPTVSVPGFLFRYLVDWHNQLQPEKTEALVRPRLDRYITTKGSFDYSRLQLKPSEKTFLDIVKRKSYRFREVFTLSNLNRRKTGSILLTLSEMQLVDYSDSEAATQILDRVRRSLKRKIDAMNGQNYFDKLEIHWTSQTVQVERSYKRLGEQLARLSRRVKLTPDLEKMRGRIQGELKEAYEALRHQPKRIAHRKDHYEETQQDFAADLLVKQAELLSVRKDWGTVVDNLERALELQPRHSKARALLKASRVKAQEATNL